MINEQLFRRVIDTLKSNNDAAIVAVADEGGKVCKVWIHGRDELLIPLIDTVGETYIEDVVKDAGKNNAGVDIATLGEIDSMLKELNDSVINTNKSIEQADELTKQIEDALNEIDFDQLFEDLGEDGEYGPN